MIMVRAAPCTAECAERSPFVIPRQVEQMTVDTVQQVEAFQCLLLEGVSVPGASIPGSDDMQAKGYVSLLGTAAHPFHGQELDEYRRCVERFFLLNE